MRIAHIILWGFLLSSLFCSAQNDDSPKPLKPTFDVLTLNPQTGTPTLSWHAPDYNPLNPNPTGYLIYIAHEGGGWVKIDSVNANTFTYTDNVNNGLSRCIQYVIASKGPNEPSPLTAPHGSIHVTSAYDSCANSVDISWNQYIGWGNRIDRYEVYMGDNPNWENLPLVSTIIGTQTFTSYQALPNKDYYMYVKAVKKDEEFTSFSNLNHINTRIAQPPQFMFVDSLVAKDNSNEIYFSIDQTTQYKNFELVRWESPDSVLAIFTGKSITKFTDPAMNHVTDDSDSWSARSKPFYYRLHAYDGCNRLQRISNLSNTVTIRTYNEGSKPVIAWEKFYSEDNNSIKYKLYRISTRNGITESEMIFSARDPEKNEYTDDLSPFDGQGYLPSFCYYLEAFEDLPESDKYRTSRSRIICTQVQPEVIMPNAIDPLSTIIRNGVPRNIFAPIITFQMDYKLTIYSRGGTIVFEGSNEGWNGRMPNGQLAPEGAYIYRLEVISDSYSFKTQTGSVTVMYGPQ